MVKLRVDVVRDEHFVDGHSRQQETCLLQLVREPDGSYEQEAVLMSEIVVGEDVKNGTKLTAFENAERKADWIRLGLGLLTEFVITADKSDAYEGKAGLLLIERIWANDACDALLKLMKDSSLAAKFKGAVNMRVAPSLEKGKING